MKKKIIKNKMERRKSQKKGMKSCGKVMRKKKS